MLIFLDFYEPGTHNCTHSEFKLHTVLTAVSGDSNKLTP
jgi:hypothetical protein